MLDTRLKFLSRLSQPNDRKILFIVIDGLGGLYDDKYGGKTELQYANLPHIDTFVQHKRTVTGLIYPIRRGIVPGSGAGHLGLFGYDPLYYEVGRGSLEAADLPTGEVDMGDITARFNLCNIDGNQEIIDRRAGRIALNSYSEAVDLLNKRLSIVDGTKMKLILTKEYRGVLIIKNTGELSPNITDTDPGYVGKNILKAKPINRLIGGQQSVQPTAVKTADIVNKYTAEAIKILKNKEPANAIIFRGFSTFPDLPKFNTVYSLKAAAIAAYPLYRGISKIVGMSTLGKPANLEEEVEILRDNFDNFDFFFLHYKDPDSRGEDGDFKGKVEALERFDNLFPEMVSENIIKFSKGEYRFQVIALTGDHSTPARIGAHTDHSVPLAIYADTMKGFDKTRHFDEEECTRGTIGRIIGIELMTILLAKAGKLRKFEGFEREE